MNNEPTFYSVSEIAKLLNLHQLTVYRHIQNGKLKASRLGKIFRISAEDFFAYMNSSHSTGHYDYKSSSKSTISHFLTKRDPFYQLVQLLADE